MTNRIRAILTTLALTTVLLLAFGFAGGLASPPAWVTAALSLLTGTILISLGLRRRIPLTPLMRVAIVLGGIISVVLSLMTLVRRELGEAGSSVAAVVSVLCAILAVAALIPRRAAGEVDLHRT